jgi:hypothetical protein
MAIISIIETVFQYPAATLIKDFKSLREGLKPYRNVYRILCGAVGSALGGVVPTLIWPGASHYVSGVLQAVLPIGGAPSLITGNLALVYVGFSSGLLFGKYSAQAYYYLRYKDTNSGHILYPHLLRQAVVAYEGTKLGSTVLSFRIEGIFTHLVQEIKRVKDKHQGNPLEPLSLSWTKAQLKGVLHEFMQGNEDLFNFYYRMAHMRENYLQSRLQSRIQEIEQLLVQEVPHPNTLHLRAHVRRATISTADLAHQHPKLARYVTQIKPQTLPITSSDDLEHVKSLLLSKSHQVQDATRLVPEPLVKTEGATLPKPIGTRRLRIDV